MSLTWTTAAVWLAHSAAGGALLLLLTWVLARRTRQPARRQRLAEWGVAAALVVAGLSWAPAWLVLDWAAPAAAPAAAKPAAIDPPAAPPILPGKAAVLVLRPELEEGNGPEEGAVFPAEEFAAALPVDLPAPPAPAAAPPPDPAPFPDLVWLAALTPWLVGAYGLLAAWFCGRWLLGHLALWRLLRSAVPAPDHVALLFQTMTPTGRRPRLLVSHRLRVPVSCGLWRPAVVLPAAMCGRADPQKLRWVFAHELTHVERRDAWSAVLFGLAQGLYFFVPWFWWLRGQVRLCQEYVADAAAVQPRQAADYAEFLLSLITAPATPRAATGVAGPSSDLYRRVTMLLQEPLRVEKRCPRRWSLTAALGLLGLAVVVAGVGWRGERAAAAAVADDDVIIVIKKKAADAKPAAAQAVKVRALLVPGPDQVKKAEDVIILWDFVPGQGGQAAVEKLPPGARVIWRHAGQGDRDVFIQRVPAPARFEAPLGGQPGKRAVVEDVIIQKAAPGQDQVFFKKVMPGQGGALFFKKKGDVKLEELHKALDHLDRIGDPNSPQVKELRQSILKALKDIDVPVEFEFKLEQVAPGQQPKVVPPPQGFRIEVLGEKIKKLQQGRRIEIELAPGVGGLPGLPPLQGVPGRIELKLGKDGKLDPKVLEEVRDALKAGDFKKAQELIERAVARQKAAPQLEQARAELERAQAELEVARAKLEALARQEQRARQQAEAERQRAQAMEAEARARLEKMQAEVFQKAKTAVVSKAPLGLQLEAPAAVVADQLSLPRNVGLVVTGVTKGSAADKAGFQVNDVLLSVAGRPVANDPKAFQELVGELKPGAAFDVTVLRKGARTTLHGLQTSAQQPQPRAQPVPPVQPVFPQPPVKAVPAQGDRDVLITTFRTADRFTTRRQEGSLIITVTGTVAGGKAQVGEITVQDGAVVKAYAGVAAVPAQYRDKVAHLVDVSARPQGHGQQGPVVAPPMKQPREH